MVADVALSSRRPVRASTAGLAAAAGAILAGGALCLTTENLLPLVVLVAVAWAPALDRSSIAAGLGKAVILLGVWGAALMLGGPLLGVRVTHGVSAASVVAVGAIAMLHRMRVGPDRSRWLPSMSWGMVAGPVLLLAGVLVSAIRFGGLAAWAMNGDARTHVLVTQAMDVDGGWTRRIAYPGLANAISAWLGAESADPTFYTQIQQQAVVWLAMLCTFAVLCGMVASQGPRPFRNARGAVGSVAAVSPLALGILHEGFFPLAWTWVLAASVALIALTPGIRTREVALYGSLGVLMAFATYPPAAPVIAMIAIGARLALLHGDWRGAALAVVPLLALAALLPLLATQDFVVVTLVAPGAALSLSWALPLALVPVAALNWVAGPRRGQWPALLALLLGVAGLILLVGWLDSLAVAPGLTYYAAKTTLAGTVALLPLCLFSSTTPRDGGPLQGRAALVAAMACLLALTHVPLLYSMPPRAPILKIARGWFLPTVDEGGLVMEVLSHDASALEWRTYEAEVDRRLNIWLSAAGAYGSLDVNSPQHLWPYDADMVAIDGFCQRLSEEPDLDVFVDTAAQQAFVSAACAVGADRVPVLGEP